MYRESSIRLERTLSFVQFFITLHTSRSCLFTLYLFLMERATRQSSEASMFAWRHMLWPAHSRRWSRAMAMISILWVQGLSTPLHVLNALVGPSQGRSRVGGVQPSWNHWWGPDRWHGYACFWSNPHHPKVCAAPLLCIPSLTVTHLAQMSKKMGMMWRYTWPTPSAQLSPSQLGVFCCLQSFVEAIMILWA